MVILEPGAVSVLAWFQAGLECSLCSRAAWLRSSGLLFMIPAGCASFLPRGGERAWAMPSRLTGGDACLRKISITVVPWYESMRIVRQD